MFISLLYDGKVFFTLYLIKKTNQRRKNTHETVINLFLLFLICALSHLKSKKKQKVLINKKPS